MASKHFDNPRQNFSYFSPQSKIIVKEIQSSNEIY